MKQNIPSIRRPLALAVLSLASAASVAQAHPGHGLFDDGVRHALTSPEHLLVLAAAGAMLAGSAFLVRKARVRRGLQIVGVLMIAAALAVWRLAA